MIPGLPVPAGENPLHPSFTSEVAFAAYEHVRRFLPPAEFPAAAQYAPDLGAIADLFDVFVFDAFGVLNVGDTPIPGAVERVNTLRALGKSCVVVTNAASYDPEASFAKFQRLGFNFPHSDIATSRQAAEEAVLASNGGRGWGVLGLDEPEAGSLPFAALFPRDDERAYDAAEGFLFLSNARWTAERQAMLERSLSRRARPVIIGNADIIAPREQGLSTEPGYFGYRLVELGLGNVSFHGKPFPSVYDLVRRRHPAIAHGARVVMIGDTLHTDVVGGASQGWSTVLVSDHGLFRGMDVTQPIVASGIVPDFIVPNI